MFLASTLNTPDPPEPCSGFRMMLPPCALANALMSDGVLGDQGLGPRLGRKGLEIELVDRPAEAVRIVEHDHAAPRRLAPEQDADVHRPGAFWASIDGSLRSISTSTSVMSIGSTLDRLLSFKRREEVGAVLIFALGREAGVGAQHVVAAEHEIGRRDVADAVAARASPGARARSSCNWDIRARCR